MLCSVVVPFLFVLFGAPSMLLSTRVRLHSWRHLFYGELKDFISISRNLKVCKAFKILKLFLGVWLIFLLHLIKLDLWVICYLFSIIISMW